jgi:hypothetical protein
MSVAISELEIPKLQRQPLKLTALARETVNIYAARAPVAYRGGLGGSNPPPPKFRNFDKIPKIKKILVYEMKFLVPNYSCLQNP